MFTGTTPFFQQFAQKYCGLIFCFPKPLTTQCSVTILRLCEIATGFFINFEPWYSAGNNFSLFTGHMSFQIFILVGHLTNWTRHNLLTGNTLKKITQDVLVRCSVIVSDHDVKLAGHFQNLVRQCLMTDCYFQHCWYISLSSTVSIGIGLLEFDLICCAVFQIRGAFVLVSYCSFCYVSIVC